MRPALTSTTKQYGNNRFVLFFSFSLAFLLPPSLLKIMIISCFNFAFKLQLDIFPFGKKK